MRNILAKKEQELIMLQKKKVEMELEQMRRQVEIAEKTVVKKVRFIYTYDWVKTVMACFTGIFKKHYMLLFSNISMYFICISIH